RAGPVPEHDLLVVLLDHVEVAADAPLQVDEHLGDLLAGEHREVQGRLVPVVDLFADPLTDHAEKPGRLLETNDVLKGTGEFAQRNAVRARPGARTRGEGLAPTYRLRLGNRGEPASGLAPRPSWPWRCGIFRGMDLVNVMQVSRRGDRRGDPGSG